MSFILGACLGLMGYCVGKLIEGAIYYRRGKAINQALTEYIRNHRPQ